MVKVKRMWAYVAVGSAGLALLSMTLGNYFGGSLPIPLPASVGLTFGIFFIGTASFSAGVVNTMAWYERKCKAENSHG